MRRFLEMRHDGLRSADAGSAGARISRRSCMRAAVVLVLPMLAVAAGGGAARVGEEDRSMAESEEARQRRYQENRERQRRMIEERNRRIDEQLKRDAEEEKTIPAVNRQYLL